MVNRGYTGIGELEKMKENIGIKLRRSRQIRLRYGRRIAGHFGGWTKRRRGGK